MPSEDSQYSLTKVINLIRGQPLDVELWQRVSRCLKAQKDKLSGKSLAVIIGGLADLKTKTQDALQKLQAPPAISPAATQLFVKLASKYNDPLLLAEIGKIYLTVWQLPVAALQHFERAQRLGGSEKELRPLIEAASVAIQRRVPGVGQPAYSGLRNADQAHPVVPQVLRKSGLLIPSSRALPQVVPREKKVSNSVSPNPLPIDTHDCLEQAAEAVQQGELDRAGALLLKANDQPADAQDMRQAWANLGLAYHATGAYHEMENACEAALKYDAKCFSSSFNLALARQLLQKYEQAESLYLAADRFSPDNPKVWCNLGSLYFQTGRYPEAEMALRKAIAAKPDYARAWDNLGSALGAQNKLAEAVEACQKAIEHKPGYPEAYFKMGLVLFSDNSLQEAAKAFAHAAVSPQLASSAHAMSAMIHARLEDTEAAAAAIALAIKADPHGDLLWMAWNELGHAYLSLDEYAPAASAYEAATKLKPTEAEAWFHLGLACHSLKDLGRAQQAYEHAIKLNRDLYSAWHNLGLIYAEKGLHPAATECFRHEVRVKATSSRAWHDLASSLEIEGKKEEAREAFAKAEAFMQLTSP